MKNKHLRHFLFLLLSFWCLDSHAQEETQVKNMLHAVSAKYGDLKDISFDVSFTARTTAPGEKPAEDKMTGQYILSGKKAFYQIGQTEAILNDSLLIGIYNEDKLIVVSDAGNNNNARFFPFRETMDSLLNLSAEKYIISTSKDNNLATISFKAKDPAEPVTGFIMVYNTQDQLLRSLQYDSKEYHQPENDAKTNAPVLVNKTMLIQFSNYKQATVPEDIFKTDRYIIFKDGSYVSSEKYAGYQLYYNQKPKVN